MDPQPRPDPTAGASATALPRRVALAGHVIDLATHEVFEGGALKLRLTPKALGVLRVLLEHEGTPVRREQLISKVWPHQFPTDDVVTKAIRELRRALGETEEQPVIATLPRIGYLLKPVPQWQPEPSRSDPALPLPADAEAEPGPSAVADDPPAPAASAAPATPAAAVPAASRQPWLAVALVLALLLGAGAVLLRPAPEPPALALADMPELAPMVPPASMAPRLDVLPFTADPGDEGAADVSDDGRLVAYSGKPRSARFYRIYVRSVDGLSERRLTSVEADEDETQPVFAPDGHQVAYQVIGPEGRCELRLIDLNGGPVRHLADCARGYLVPLEFARDGSHLVVPRVGRFEQGKTGFERIDLASGQIGDLDYPHDPQALDVEARYSPDGRYLLIRRGSAPDSQLLLHTLDSTAPPRVLAGISGLIRGVSWLPDNRHLVFATDATGVMELWRLDIESGATERFGGIPSYFPSVAARAPVLVARQVLRPSALLALQVDGMADAEPRYLFASTRGESWPAYAPDGRTLAFVSDRSGSSQIYLGDLASGEAQQVSRLESGKPYALSFAPDGGQIAFTLRQLDGTRVGLVDLSGRWTRLLDIPGVQQPARLRFAADGSLWLDGGSGDRHRVYRMATHDAPALPFGGCDGRLPHPAADGTLYLLGPGYGPLQVAEASPGTGSAPAPAPTAEPPMATACRSLGSKVGWSNMDAWTVHGNGVVYAAMQSSGSSGLFRLEPGNGASTLLEPIGHETGSAPGLTLSPDGRQAVLGLSVETQGDLLLVRGF